MSIAGQFAMQGTQVYVPLLELSGNLIYNFSRNANTIKNRINGYTKLVPTKGLRGNFVTYNPEDNARLHRNLEWALNTPRPVGVDNGISFTTGSFECRRYQDARVEDMVTLDVNNIKVQEFLAASLAQNMVTNRARIVCSTITTSGNYPATNVRTATQLGGGFADTGTPANPVLLQIIQEAKAIIQGGTFGRFQDSELGLLCNPNTARRLARTRELREYVSNQVSSPEFLKLSAKEYNGGYGLMPLIYNTPIIVEDTMFTAANPNAGGNNGDKVASFVFPDNVAVVFARPGDLEQEEAVAGQDYASFTQFVYGKSDMALQSVTDQWNSRFYMGIEDFFDVKVTCPFTAVLITNLFS